MTRLGFSASACPQAVGSWSLPTRNVRVERESSTLVKRPPKNARIMNPQSQANANDAMRPEYDFSPGVRGKHHQAYRAGTNVVFLERDLAEVFPDSASVNHALRLLVKLARTKGLVGGRPNKALQPTSRAKRKAKPKRRSRAARG